VHEEFLVSFTAEDWRLHNAQAREVQFSLSEFPDLLDDSMMLDWVFHHATFAYLTSPNFKLRLDQCEDTTRGFQKGDNSRKDLLHRDEGDIDYCQVERFGEVLPLEVARVNPFSYNNPRIAPQSPIELMAPHINGVDPLRAVLEQTIREAACRSSDVNADESCHLNLELSQSRFEFQPTATSVANPRPCDLDVRIGSHRFAGLVNYAVINENLSRENKRLSFLACLSEAQRNKQAVNSFFEHSLPH